MTYCFANANEQYSDRYFANVNNGAVGSKEIRAKFNRANTLKFKCEGLWVTKEVQSYTEREKQITSQLSLLQFTADNFPYSFENIPAAKKMAVGFLFVIKCLGHECSEFFIINHCSDCEVSQQKIIIVQKCKLLQLTGILSNVFQNLSKVHRSAGYLHSHFVPNKIK